MDGAEIEKIQSSIKRNKETQIVSFIFAIASGILMYTSVNGGPLSGGFPFSGFIFAGVINTIAVLTLFFASLKNITNIQLLKKNGLPINNSSLYFSYLILGLFVLVIVIGFLIPLLGIHLK